MNHICVSVSAAATLRDISAILPSFPEAVNNTYMTVLKTAVYREAHKQANSFPFRLFPATLQLLVRECDVREMSTDTLRGQKCKWIR
jgi:hypothetical protein